MKAPFLRLAFLFALALMLTAPGCRKARVNGREALSKPYVASGWRRKMFHRTECEWVEKLEVPSLIGFDTRQEAIDEGLEPCPECKP